MFTISMTKEETVSQNTMPPIPPPSELSPGKKNCTKSITNLHFVSSGDFGNSSQHIQLAKVTSNLSGDKSKVGTAVLNTQKEKGTTTQNIHIQTSEKKRKHQVS